MDEPKNRRADDRHPTTPLRWGERWTLLLTGPHHGMIGPYGSTWPNQSAEYERVNVIAETADQTAEADVEPIAWMRPDEIKGLKEAAGKQSEERFYGRIYARKYQDDMVPVCQVPRVIAPKLDSIEQYRLQMAAIGTASFGYWKEGDTIHPDYDTVPLRDVARLYAKYEALHAFHSGVRTMINMLKNREWAEDLGAHGDLAELQGLITELVGKAGMQDSARLDWMIAEECKIQTTTAGARTLYCIHWPDADEWQNAYFDTPRQAIDEARAATKQAALQELADQAQELDMGYGAPAQPAAPDAVEAAMVDAIVHGTGAFSVQADGSTQHVDLQGTKLSTDGNHEFDWKRDGATVTITDVRQVGLSKEDQRHYAELAAFPPKLQRDALYQDYAVPKPEGKPE